MTTMYVFRNIMWNRPQRDSNPRPSNGRHRERRPFLRHFASTPPETFVRSLFVASCVINSRLRQFRGRAVPTDQWHLSGLASLYRRRHTEVATVVLWVVRKRS